MRWADPSHISRASSLTRSSCACYREHFSSVLHRTLSTSDAQEFDITGIPQDQLYNPDYDVDQNRFGVKAGQTLSDWEKSGWINEQDPRGWFQVSILLRSYAAQPPTSHLLIAIIPPHCPSGTFVSTLVDGRAMTNDKFPDGSVLPVQTAASRRAWSVRSWLPVDAGMMRMCRPSVS